MSYSNHGSGFGSDASESLNAITAPDGYSALATIEDTPIKYIVLDVANQAIFFQLKKSFGGPTGSWEDHESFQIPGSRVLTRAGVVGIRVRAVIPAAQLPVGALQAVVTVEAVK